MLKYNLYDILAGVRLELNEYSAGYVQGTDESGRYNNTYLNKKINEAYRAIYASLSVRNPDKFTASVSIVGSNSVLTKPADFGAVIQFRDDNGLPVYPIGWKNRANGLSEGSMYEYYENGNTLVLNKSGVGRTFTLFYKKRCRNLEMGQAASGSGAAALKLDPASSATDDFYNGFDVVVKASDPANDFTDTITDYAGSTQVATITGTAAEDDWYGFVPEIDEVYHHMIERKATLMVRSGHPLAEKNNLREDYQTYNEELADLLQAYDTGQDVPREEDFEDFEDFEG
jgi:hypothetical protein